VNHGSGTIQLQARQLTNPVPVVNICLTEAETSYAKFLRQRPAHLFPFEALGWCFVFRGQRNSKVQGRLRVVAPQALAQWKNILKIF